MTKTRKNPMVVWTQVNWRKLERIVYKLQKRIYHASQRGDVKAVRKLQKTLLNSWSAKMLAVRRVTQDNQGKNTAGIDGKKALTPKERLILVQELGISHKSKATRRVWIPKPGKTEKRHGSRNKSGEPTPVATLRSGVPPTTLGTPRQSPQRGEPPHGAGSAPHWLNGQVPQVGKPAHGTVLPNALPPLDIPTISERAKQALVKLALEPEWEAKFEPNSYGFRPGRSCMDAIEGIKAAIKQKSKYVLDADIAKCFDQIDHEKLLNKINTFPKLRRQIKAWLKSGVYNHGTWFPTDEGTSQSGVISPLLANIAIHGMEKIVKEFARTLPGKKDNNEKEITIIRYADDFVILHPNLDVLMRAKALIEEFLKDMGLELRPEKTRVTHTLEEIGKQPPGFDFLGFNIRQYPVGNYATGKSYKTYVKPSKKAIKAHYQRLTEEIDKLKSCQSQIDLIKRLNPIITGWSNYYSKVNSADTFKKLDHLLTLKLIAWAKARHLHKSIKRWTGKYFGTKGESCWIFRAITDGKNRYLTYHGDFYLQKFVKVEEEVSPYNGDLTYWATRMGKSAELPTRVSKLLKKQNGKCTECGMHLGDGDVMEVDDVLPRSKGGKDTYENYQLLHNHCYDIKTKRDGSHDKSQIIEEPCDAKVSRTVLKPSHVGDSVA